jgi:hypothetical protein
MLYIIKQFWNYLGETQTKSIRIIHSTIATLIIVQIIDSYFIHTKHGLNWGAWLHISIGICIAVMSVDFVSDLFKRKGIKHFYPYLYGDFKQLNKDIKSLLTLKLPAAKAEGLATVVQGLGLGALFIVILSGLSWFGCWLMGLGITHDVKEIHEFLTLFIEIYISAHGAMGVIHFLVEKYFPSHIAK